MYFNKQIFFNIMIIALVHQTIHSMGCDRDGRVAVNDHTHCTVDNHGSIIGNCCITIGGDRNNNNDGGWYNYNGGWLHYDDDGGYSFDPCANGEIAAWCENLPDGTQQCHACPPNVIASNNPTVIQAVSVFKTLTQKTNIDPVILSGMLNIYRLFDSNQGIYKGMGQYKNASVNEYVTRECQIKQTHYCFAHWNMHEEPPLRFANKSEELSVMALLKKMNEEGQI